MGGAILAIPRVKARAMQTWADATPKSFSNCYTAGDSLNRTHVRCFPIHRGCCVSSPTPKDCVIGSGGVRGGAGANATAVWAARLGMNLQSSTLKFDETGEPFHIQQAAQIRAFRAAWKEAGHARTPRASVSRSIFALVNDLDLAYFGRSGEDEDKIGLIDRDTRAIFGRSYAAEPDVLIEQLKEDEAIAEADTLLLTVPNQLGVAYNVHVLEAILKFVAPGLGWR